MYDFEQHKILNCLNGHPGRVNNVVLLQTNEGTTGLCSVDSNKTMIIWTTNDVKSLNWDKQVFKDAHTAEINNCTATRFNDLIFIATF